MLKVLLQITCWRHFAVSQMVLPIEGSLRCWGYLEPLLLGSLMSFLESGRKIWEPGLFVYISKLQSTSGRIRILWKSGFHWNTLSHSDFLGGPSLKWGLYVMSSSPCSQYPHFLHKEMGWPPSILVMCFAFNLYRIGIGGNWHWKCGYIPFCPWQRKRCQLASLVGVYCMGWLYQNFARKLNSMLYPRAPLYTPYFSFVWS